jgi:hypothetical protein
MNANREINYSVRRIHQSGGLEHVVVYNATVWISDDSPQVTIECAAVDVAQANPVLLEAALGRIKQGIEKVLRPLGKGALVEIRDLIIHPVDFIEDKFEAYTIKYFTETLRSIGR